MKSYIKYLHKFFLILALASITVIQAQTKYLKLKAAAEIEYTNFKYTHAIKLCEQIVRYHPDDAFAISTIADCYWRMRQFNSSLLWYEKLKLPTMDSVNMSGYIYALMASGKYTEAKIKCKEYILLHTGENKISGLLQHIEHLDLFFRDSATRKAEFLNINTSGEDFCPVFYKKGLVFVSSKSKNKTDKKSNNLSPSFCKIYYLTDTATIEILPGNKSLDSQENKQLPYDKNGAVPILNMGVKTNLNIGPVTFSSDGKTAYYSYNGKMQKDLRVSRVELFSASYSNGNFTGKKSFEYNGTDYSVEHPSLSPDGQFLYFASNKKGGAGAFDIYSCKRNDTSWNIPINLGNLVNTEGNEMFPFADSLGNLYFASDGWPGLGALDIFYVKMKDGLPVSAPLNLGYPVNSSYDDFGIALEPNNVSGYFSSNRRNSNDDIYRFDYQKDEKYSVLDTLTRIRTDGKVVNKKEEMFTWTTSNNLNSDSLVYIKGTVMDSISKLRVDGVTIDIKEVDGTNNFHFVTDNSGNFGAYFKKDGLLDIVLSKPGFHPYHICVRTEQLRYHFLMAFLKPDIDAKEVVKKDPATIINPALVDDNSATFEDELNHLTDSLHITTFKKYSVYFNFASSIISLGEKNVADSIINIIKNHPELNVLVAGFTDCIGGSIVNMQLSKMRAVSVKKLLQKLGLNPSRINTEYFGKKRLVIPCEEGQAYDMYKQRMNRRSEIVLILPTKISENVQKRILTSNSKNQPAIVTEEAEAYDLVNKSKSVKGKAILNNDETPKLIKVKTIAAVDSKTILKDSKNIMYSKVGVKDKTAAVAYQSENSTGREIGNIERNNSHVNSYSNTELNKSKLTNEISKRINKKPIFLHTNSDSVHIEIYDNGVFDYDTISVIFNGQLITFKQLLRVDKAISFYVKIDEDVRKNELIFFADNLGLIPPNSALMVITDGEGIRTEVSVTNDLGHNTVIYFIKPNKTKTGS